MASVVADGVDHSHVREPSVGHCAAVAALRALYELDDMLGLAQMERSALVEKLLLKAEGKLTAEQLRAQNGVEQRSPKEIAKDRASYELDLVVAAPEDFSWESARAPLAERYTEADMASIATFVRGAWA